MEADLEPSNPPKLKLFTWLFCQSKLLTNVNRMSRHITSDPCCIHCPNQPETMLHLSRDCPKANVIWMSIGSPTTIQRTFCLDWNNWVGANILQRDCKFLGFNWNQLFIFICWFIWKWRNKGIFDPCFCDPHNASSSILQYISEWKLTSDKIKSESTSSVCFLSWQKSPSGFLKLNADGSRSSGGLIEAGGVIKDCTGQWCNGFMRNVGNGEVLTVEAWDLVSGLQLAKDLGITHLMVESDSSVLINLLLKS